MSRRRPDTPRGPDTLYGIENLPYGIFSPQGQPARVGVRLGDAVLDLSTALGDPVFKAPALNGFLAAGRRQWADTRDRIQGLLGAGETRPAAMHALADVEMHLPFEVADYVDFYGNEHHAANAGRIFRPGGAPLPPNWKHMPIAYHGRAGSLVRSGTPIVRPRGQIKPPEGPPVFSPSEQLDFEAEVGFVVGTPSKGAEAVALENFRDHVFGVCLVNDWSARDIQAWESVPLGPFLGKSFATSVSSWIVQLDALNAARVEPPPRDVAPLAYLTGTEDLGYDISLEVCINGEVVSRPPFSTQYWTPAQMMAHCTANGAPLRTGDLLASGTVSGPEPSQRGCLLELSWGGTEPITVGGAFRSFLLDGDDVEISATAPGVNGSRIGLGSVSGRVHPASRD